MMPQDRILPKKEKLALLPPTAEAATPLSDQIVVGKSFVGHSGLSKTKEKGPGAIASVRGHLQKQHWCLYIYHIMGVLLRRIE